ncbi:MAG: GAF domain-containing protein [Myxococcota bacterium]|jgi:hypothetical protein|nr:GAF domain-containing protein [Myxococcota bacterium]
MVSEVMEHAIGPEEQAAMNSVLRATLEKSTLDDVLHGILDKILQVPWLRLQKKGAIFLTEAGDPPVLKLCCEVDLAPPLLELCARVPFGGCLCGRAAQSQEVQFSSCVDERHEVRFDGMAPHGRYNIPIVSAGETLGVIVLYLPHGFERKDREVQFLRAIAKKMAGLILRDRTNSALTRLAVKLDDVKHATVEPGQMDPEFISTMNKEVRKPIEGVLRAIEHLLSSNLRDDQRERVTTVRSSAEALLKAVYESLAPPRNQAGSIRKQRASLRRASS